MPRRAKTDGDAPPKTRVRKKKESTSICGTPGIDMKLDTANSMTAFDQMGGPPMGGNIPPPGQPPMMTSNGPNIFSSPDDMPLQGGPGPAAGPAGMSMPPFSGAPHSEYFYQHHHGGGPPGGMPPPSSQLPPMPSGPPHNMPLYGGPMMPSHPGQQPGPPPQPHPAALSHQMPLPSQQFGDAEQQPSAMPPPPPTGGGPPFMYQQNPGNLLNPFPGGPPLPNGQPNMIPAHLMQRQIAMTPFGPNFPQQPFLEYRLSEMNRRLQAFSMTRQTLQATDHAQWWEAFSHEFFDDDAKMTISLLDAVEMTNRKYTIGRALIPRFHRTLFDSGVAELHYVARTPVQERISTQQWGLCALDCENVLMITKYERPNAEVHTECRLLIEFAMFDEMVGYRIKHWAIELRNTDEYFKENNLDNMGGMPKMRLTRYGLPPSVLHYLKMCQILEPMQILMHFSKANNNAPPQDCLKQFLFQQHMRFTHHQQQQQQQQHQQHQQQQQQQQQLAAHMNAGGVVPMGQPGMSSVPQTPTQDDTVAAGGKKPPRKRQRKNAAGATGANTAPSASPTKKKGSAGTATAAAVAATSSPSQAPAHLTANIPPPGQLQQPPPPQPQPQQQQMPPPGGGAPFPHSHPGIFNPPYQEVMVVGEPSMMGCEFGESDERMISRITNSQYRP